MNQTYVKLNNELEIPQFGLGVFQVPDGIETENAVNEAIKMGIRHIDTAHAYQNETHIRWHLQDNNIAIPGSSNPDHILENFQIFDFELTPDEMAKIKALDKNKRLASY